MFHQEKASPALKALVASAGYRLALEPLRPGAAIGPRAALWLLQGAALVVLAIGCLNVVNLFLARLNARRPELSVRLALGATWRNLLAEVLAESLLLTLGASILGLCGAYAALQVFNRYLPSLIEGAPAVPLDLSVLLWSLAAFLAVLLLVGSALLLRSFAKVLESDPGYAAGQIVSANINLSSAYATPAERQSAQTRIAGAFRSIPGVQNVATSLRAMLGNERPVPFARRGEDLGSGSQALIHIVAVSPEFFDTMGMPLLNGRGFSAADDFSKVPVAVVDSSFAERHARQQTVVGEEIYLNWGLPLAVDAWPRIVGVVGRANLTGLDSRDRLPIVYVPTVAQAPRSFEVLVRTQRPAPEVLREMRLKLAELDPGLHLQGAGTLGDKLGSLLLPRRGITLLIACFSALALVLAAVGLYGMLAYDVSQRTRDLGVRGAVGATRAQLVLLVLRQGFARGLWGLLAGLFLSLLATRLLGALLFGIGTLDAPAYTAVLGLLLLIILLASWLPAYRASRVDPLQALRAE